MNMHMNMLIIIRLALSSSSSSSSYVPTSYLVVRSLLLLVVVRISMESSFFEGKKVMSGCTYIIHTHTPSQANNVCPPFYHHNISI
jgi:hypothetical protein